MLRFLDYGRPVPVLPVHDSFILHHGYQHELKAFMELEFYEMFGQDINVELEYGGPASNHDASVSTNLDDLLDTLPGYEKRLWLTRRKVLRIDFILKILDTWLFCYAFQMVALST